jgi:hypothetical protein
MSQFVFGPEAKGLPVEVFTKNQNNPSSIRLKCKCGNFLGTLGQYRPDNLGRRKVTCKELKCMTPAATVEYLRRLKANPEAKQGCGAYLFYDTNAQVIAVIEKGTTLHTRVTQMEAELIKKEAEKARLATWFAEQAKLQKKIGRGGGV